MKKQHYLLLIALAFILLSCSSQKQVMWVSGYQTDCNMGAGSGKCLNISTEKDLEKVNWQSFYDRIDGFKYEPGYLKKIQVKKENVDAKNVPADASTLKYTLVKEMEKHIDNRTLLNTDWTLATINNHPINRMVVVPTLKVDLNFNRISGNGGCNSYGAEIKKLTQSEITLASVIGTMKACMNKNIEGEYFKALNKIASYKVENDKLSFYDNSNNEVLMFLRNNNVSDNNIMIKTPNQRLYDIWAVIAINQKPVEIGKTQPRLEINLNESTIMGFDGCNNYQGKFMNLDDKSFEIEKTTLISTEKYCIDNNVIPQQYMTALLQAKTYKLEKMNLILYDERGTEVLRFIKVD